MTEQTSSGSPLTSVDDNAQLVALQLGNTYGLVFLVAIAVLYTTSEIKVVRNYLVACWLADISHVYVCYHVLGRASFVDVAGWNSMTWGNVGATVSSAFFYYLTARALCFEAGMGADFVQSMLCLVRTAYLTGLFGPDAPASQKKRQ